jgi:hypothetical protein
MSRSRRRLLVAVRPGARLDSKNGVTFWAEGEQIAW